MSHHPTQTASPVDFRRPVARGRIEHHRQRAIPAGSQGYEASGGRIQPCPRSDTAATFAFHTYLEPWLEVRFISDFVILSAATRAWSQDSFLTMIHNRHCPLV